MSHATVSRVPIPGATLIAVVAFLATALATPDAGAYPRYNSGCQTCHGGFTQGGYQPLGGGPRWPSSLHDVHRGGSYMGASCGLCHLSGDSRNPYLDDSDGTGSTTGAGCVGCHGQVIGGAPSGAGLRAHHDRVMPGTCSGCHGTAPAPIAESEAPAYYGSPDCNVAASCNDDAAESEDWNGDHWGLDNDGDGLYDGDDPDCAAGPACGDGTVDSGETCDPPDSCPTSCDDGDACTADTLSGSSATCDAACSHAPIVVCAGGDGCCPGGCDANGDGDCAPACGNGAVESGETCDPPGSCPTSCNDGDACTTDTLGGAPNTCDAQCGHSAVTACANGDGCCPSGCNAANDADCAAECGNGALEAGETCDPPGTCPTACDDGDACTADALVGSAASCDATCAASPIHACTGGDGCCPAGCDVSTDSDCVASCGDGVITGSETCDPPGSCPSSCDDGDACTTDTASGSAASCDAACAHQAVTACQAGDGCCPAGCDAASDGDCAPSCGDGVLGAGETCDPPGSCPTSCDDGDPCTTDSLSGDAGACTAACHHTAIVGCGGGGPVEECEDDECERVCGDGVLQEEETCDPPGTCPVEAACDDGDACTRDRLRGHADECDARCENRPVHDCENDDGCCPDGCSATEDSDCAVSCGDGVVEADETCDPPGSCPSSCDDGDACTTDTATGSADDCSAACAHALVLSCGSADGCCPAGCDSTDDPDCAASCGNGIQEAGETCDPPESCPVACDDGNACTADALVGSPAACDAACVATPVVECVAGDGCCPAGCAGADADCSPSCGDGVVGTGETCDPPGSCPADCDDGNACTTDMMTGNGETCSAACTHAALTACVDGDGCCPAGCDPEADDDCSAGCGDGVVDEGETCDPPESCQEVCDDGNACTRDALTGSADNCNAACSFVAVVSCEDGDGCCPAGCDASTDDDCSLSCGDGVVGEGETCDPPGSCVDECDDGNACTIGQLTGSADTCNAACSFVAIVSCTDGDGCCPAGCVYSVDGDCPGPAPQPGGGDPSVEIPGLCSPSTKSVPESYVLLALFALALVAIRRRRATARR